MYIYIFMELLSLSTVCALDTTARFVVTKTQCCGNRNYRKQREQFYYSPKCTPFPVCGCGRRRCASIRKTQTRADTQCHRSSSSRVIWNNRTERWNPAKQNCVSCDIICFLLRDNIVSPGKQVLAKRNRFKGITTAWDWTVMMINFSAFFHT